MIGMKLFYIPFTVILLVLGSQAGLYLIFKIQPTTTFHTDLIIVFPGESSRIATGFKLVQNGLAPNFALAGINSSKIMSLSRQYGKLDGVNVIPSVKSRSTLEDALALKEIVKQYNFNSVLLVTSTYHMPRAFLLARLVLIGTKVRLTTYPAETKDPVASRDKIEVRCKDALNEIAKFWGSGFELASYLATGILPRDIPILKKISLFMRKNIFS